MEVTSQQAAPGSPLEVRIPSSAPFQPPPTLSPLILPPRPFHLLLLLDPCRVPRRRSGYGGPLSLCDGPMSGAPSEPTAAVPRSHIALDRRGGGKGRTLMSLMMMRWGRKKKMRKLWLLGG